MSEAVLKRLAKQFESHVIDTSTDHGNEVALLDKAGLREVCLWLRDDPSNQFNLLRDITAVDYLGYMGGGDGPRFAVVYMLYSITKKHSIRLKVPLAEDDLTVDTVSDIWVAAVWGERETWDMMGVVFKGHPDLRRILLYEEFEGHPLRKDFDKRASQPRMDLLAPERDALSEYKHWDRTCSSKGETSS